jgi:hypothetical protein
MAVYHFGLRVMFAIKKRMPMRVAGRLAINLVMGCMALGGIIAAAQTVGEVTLPEGTRISLQLNDHLSTKQNLEGDPFTANVIAPIYLGDRLIIPKGSTVNGTVSRVLRSGRLKGKAVMNLNFQSIRVPGRGELSIIASLARVDSEGNGGVQSEGTIKGESSTGSDVAKVLTPTLSGAGIGAITNGGKGSAIGAGVGAAVGLATIFSTRGKDIEMRRGSTMDIRLERPLVLPAESDARAVRNR